ncbi:MAG: UDP-N-acetylmuramoyl-tripeptide--D-alanyl-D-alanine ligase [Oligoflexales bacterium]|nr:UDP-N-acetylmuramoyl-tripeptide--D-alanyl-D-alanine ligase [Oligoflexales bacterium]
MLHREKYHLWLNDDEIPLTYLPELMPEPERIQTNSKLIKSGDIFIPLRGERFDGHSFIADAMGNGAACFFYEKNKKNEIPPAHISSGIPTKDTLVALQSIAKGWRLCQKDLTVVSLTGSVGKTTLKEMIQLILSKSSETLKTEGNFNNEIGVPLTLTKLTDKHRYAVIECGARRKGDITFLTNLVCPNIACLTNIGTAHIEIFGSLQNLAKGKLEIFTSSPKDCILVGHYDDERIAACMKEMKRKSYGFGFHKDADVRIVSSNTLKNGGMEILLSFRGESLNVELKLANSAYPHNVAAASAVAAASGIPLRDIATSLKDFAGLEGRYSLTKLKNHLLIDDSYNANPQSMASGLASLASGFPDRKKIVVLGDMLELGDNGDESHKSMGLICSQKVKPELLITVGERSLLIEESAVSDGFPKAKCIHFSNVDNLIEKVEMLKKCGDLFYVKASNGINLKKLVQILKTET